MIFEKDFNWYFSFVKKPILVVGGWIILFGLLSKIPLIGWIFILISLPITWLLKFAGAGYVGFITVKKQKGTNLQALASGGIFGIGIGLASALLNLFIIYLRPNLLSFVSNSVGFLTTILVEAITGMIIAFIGSIIAGNSSEGKK